MHAGAKGYLLKNLEPDELIEAIHVVVGGGTVIDPSIPGPAVNVLRESGAQLSTARTVPADRLSVLSPREREIVELIADGRTNREIAVALGLSTYTVKAYVSVIFQKLEITHRAAAAALVVRRGARHRRPDQ